MLKIILNNFSYGLHLFIDPNEEVIQLSKELNVQWIELHTGSFANIYAMLYSGLANTHHSIKELELSRGELSSRLDTSVEALENAANKANELGLKVAAGHGLKYPLYDSNKSH